MLQQAYAFLHQARTYDANLKSLWGNKLSRAHRRFMLLVRSLRLLCRQDDITLLQVRGAVWRLREPDSVGRLLADMAELPVAASE